MATCTSCHEPRSQCGCNKYVVTEPVLPACQDVDLADGAYTNATVVVQGGCIVEISAGTPLQYSPDPCCAPVGSSGAAGSGVPGAPGPPGDNATVGVGSTRTGAPGTVATVTNTGSETHAVLDFVIPQGAPGAPGVSPSGLTRDDAVLTLQDGLVQAEGIAWPPIMSVRQGSSTTKGVQVTQDSKDDSGMAELSVNIEAYDAALRADYEGKIAQLEDQLDALAQRVSAAEAKLQYISIT